MVLDLYESNEQQAIYVTETYVIEGNVRLSGFNQVASLIDRIEEILLRYNLRADL